MCPGYNFGLFQCCKKFNRSFSIRTRTVTVLVLAKPAQPHDKIPVELEYDPAEQEAQTVDPAQFERF